MYHIRLWMHYQRGALIRLLRGHRTAGWIAAAFVLAGVFGFLWLVDLMAG